MPVRASEFVSMEEYVSLCHRVCQSVCLRVHDSFVRVYRVCVCVCVSVSQSLSTVEEWCWCAWRVRVSACVGVGAHMMMMIAFIAFNSTLVPLIQGLCRSNPCKFESAGFRRN